jgi:TonB family protein
MSAAHYLLQVNIYIIVFYGFYRLLLDGETYFTGNRAYLLCAGLLSFLIPFIHLDWFDGQQVTQRLSFNVAELYMAGERTGTSAVRFDWGYWLTLIYVAGTIAFLLRFLFQLISLSRLMRNIPQGAAFSFFKKVFIDPQLPQQAVIRRHEQIHVRQLHSMDVLFFELLGTILWINPVIYLYKRTIRDIHEYLADAEAAGVQGDKQEYALLLLSKAFGVGSNTLTNSFFRKSTLKKRILMLHKEQSKKSALLKYGLILPVFGLMLLLSSATVGQNEQLKFVATNVLTGEQFKAVEESISFEPEATTGHMQAVSITDSTPPSFPGGMKAFYEYLGRTIKYPAEARKQNIQGKVELSFTVEKDGSLTDIHVNKKLGGGTDEEAVRVLRESPKWIPGTRDDKPIRVKYDMPLSFSLSETQTGDQNKNEDNNKQVAAEVTALTSQPAASITASTFSIRSSQSAKPLENIAYSIDGAPASEAEVKTLDPKRIDRIDVRKAPAGSSIRGYSGTVAVTTKPLEIEVMLLK